LKKDEVIRFHNYENKNIKKRDHFIYKCTQKVTLNKVELLNLAEELGNIPKALR
jgi:hypothetical protein